MLEILKQFVNDLTTPQSFPDSWYGYATNQISHVFIGGLMAGIVSGIWLYFNGEYPEKTRVVGVVVAIYVLWEFVFNTSNASSIPDSIEDLIFVTVYGCTAVMISFTEKTIGDSELAFTPAPAMIFALVMSVHLAAGIIKRIHNGLG